MADPLTKNGDFKDINSIILADVSELDKSVQEYICQNKTQAKILAWITLY